MALCVFVGYMLKKYKFYYLPESAAVMAIGCIAGGVVKAVNPSEEELSFLTFKPEVFFFVLLPPIIFEAGYTLNKKGFFSNFTTIMMFAVVGTLISTFVIALFMWGLAAAKAIPLEDHTPLEALLFGALISAVDPVATLAIMGAKEINCDPLLYSLVFGESVLNDAVAIVLFRTIQGFLPTTKGEVQEFNFTTVLSVLGRFLYISLGSIIIGVLIGLLCSFIFKNTHIKKYPKYEITTLILTAFGSYALSEAISMSGIMALFFTGITLSHYNFYNLSESSQISSTYVFEAVASFSETIVFAYLGTTIFSDVHKWDIWMIFFSIIICAIARAANTFPLSAFVNIKRKVKISKNMQVVIWFAGLRGAVAFALALTLSTPNAQYIITTTLCIVLFTTFICGGLTEPMLGKFGMKQGIETGPGRSSSGELGAHSLLDDDSDGSIDEKTNHGIGVVIPSSRKHSGFHGWFSSFDKRIMKPHFGGAKPSRFRAAQESGLDMSGDNLFANAMDDHEINMQKRVTKPRRKSSERGPPYSPPSSPQNGQFTDMNISDSAI
jgi:solute carrier family 9 (sodium/hydrogen exchanger), member 8